MPDGAALPCDLPATIRRVIDHGKGPEATKTAWRQPDRAPLTPLRLLIRNGGLALVRNEPVLDRVVVDLRLGDVLARDAHVQ